MSSTYYPTKDDPLTPFGAWLEREREERGVTIDALCKRTGIHKQPYRRIIHVAKGGGNSRTEVHLPWVMKVCQLLHVSPLEAFIHLYRAQAIARDMTEDELDFASSFLALFDLFFRMEGETRDMAVGVLQKMLGDNGGRELSAVQEKLLNSLRLSPDGGAGNSRVKERLDADRSVIDQRRLRGKKSDSSDDVVLSEEPVTQES